MTAAQHTATGNGVTALGSVSGATQYPKNATPVELASQRRYVAPRVGAGWKHGQAWPASEIDLRPVINLALTALPR